MSSLASLLNSLQRGFLKNVLEGAGITLGVASLSLYSINQAIDHFKSSLNSVPAGVLQLAGVVGLDIYFSLVLGAIITRLVQTSSSLALLKKK